jgi:hypothetical protein
LCMLVDAESRVHRVVDEVLGFANRVGCSQ